MKRISRLTAWLLAIALVLGSVALADRDPVSEADLDKGTWSAWTAASLESNGPVIQEGGTVLVEPSTFVPGETQLYTSTEQATLAEDAEAEQQITLPQYGMVELTATGTGAAQWQIYVPTADLWVNIAGESAATIALTYAKISNQLVDGAAKLRCAFGSDDARTYSATAKVVVSYGAPETEEATDAAEPVLAASNFALTRSADAGVMPLAGADTPGTYSVVINYKFENDEIVADPYTATLAAGENFSATVTFPTVLGYLPYLNEIQQNSIDLNYTSINQDYTINVVYKPTNVDYTVIHYQQNLDNDNYTEKERETKQGLTKSTVPEVAKDYDGFYALLYEKPEIAADGSTVVEVYYDRYYYLMNFDLDGGYGVEPIYARYGAPIGDVGTPTKAGYTFQGWTLDGTNTVSLPETMPAVNTTYKAMWKANDTAKVTVVFWGENADDEEYSYIKSSVVNVKPGTEFTYSESGSLVCALEPHTHSFENNCYQLTCSKKEHTHIESCYTCGKTNHTHGTGCYSGVGSSSSAGIGAPYNPSNGYVAREAWSRDGKVIYINGTWYKYTGSTSTGNIAPTTCGQTEGTHTHTDDCLGCGKTEHTHSIENKCYTLTCTKTEHKHTSSCYVSGAGLDSNLWTFVKSDTVTVAADGSTVVNVYYDRTEFTLTFNDGNTTVYTLKEKWGADISEHWPIKGTNGKTYNNGERWDPNGSNTYKQVLVYLAVMPAESFTLSKDSGSNKGTYYMHYMVETLPGESGTSYNGKTFKESFNVTARYNFVTKSEDFFDLEGFSQWTSSPAFNNGSININYDEGGHVYFYYTRNSYDIEFFNPTSLIKKVEDVPYETPLGAYDFVPGDEWVPEKYEPGSVKFAGWYLNPECTGKEYILSEHTMPVGAEKNETSLSLYAKWKPVTHTVEFYLNADALAAGTKLSTHPDITVPHGSKVDPVPAEPTNGSYTFVGWFYMEDGVEKAFDFANMPVTKDLRVYGKWSSNVLKTYTIYYKIQGTDTQIAESTTGSGLAGITKTFDAKGGTDLYTNYQEGFFPVTKSHSMTLDINATAEHDTNVFTFWYVQKEAVPYTVYYVTDDPDANNSLGTVTINGKKYTIVSATKTVNDNRKAVVTETFAPVNGYLPDAYQKRLVVSVDENGEPDTAHNVIIFYYTKDDKHAYYKITHYTENLAKDAQGKPTWTEYASSQAVGDINKEYTADPMTIPGFTFDETVEGTVKRGQLTANGLELKLYYKRNSYPYQVRYLKQGSGTQLHVPKTTDESGIPLTGKYGQIVSESAIDIANYTAVDPTSQTLNIRIETETDDEGNLVASLNVITFYYKEKEVTINYVAVGPEGLNDDGTPKATIAGTVSPTSETLKVLTGTAQGSTAAASSDLYRFVGWYKDANCTTPVDTSWVDANNKLTPQRITNEVSGDDGGTSTITEPWTDVTYYAKFEYNLTTLTITKTGLDVYAYSGDEDRESAIITVTVTDPKDSNSSKVYRFALSTANPSVTIKDLKVGSTYTVVEENGWTWRYEAGSISKATGAEDVDFVIDKDPTKNQVTITNHANNPYWLGGDNYAVNVFRTTSTASGDVSGDEEQTSEGSGH